MPFARVVPTKRVVGKIQELVLDLVMRLSRAFKTGSM
jgi:hypothetical protein